MDQTPTIACLIMAAGTATRFDSTLPKQYAMLGGQPILRHAIRAYANHPQVDWVQVVIHQDHQNFYDAINPNMPPDAVTIGGATRQESVAVGLQALAAKGFDYVLIADAARPLTDAATITRVIDALSPNNGAIAALPVTDTLKHAVAQKISHTVPREDMWQAQTPQAFPFAKILALHEQYKDIVVTDDAALCELASFPVTLVMGHRHNFKITTTDDLNMAERLISSKTETRIGHGYDIHRFTDGDHIWLGGVKIAHDKAVDAHSDGDLFCDALTDALLGAIGAGDIGQHFPPSDPQWKNVSSDRFVKHALGLVQAAGGRIVNVDITLFAEAPKLGPHRDAVRQNIADLLNVEILRVNVKAKTGEQMGYVGRREGLAAGAVVSIEMPHA